MKYFIVTDIHGFYTPFVEALEKSGFNKDDKSHKLIICGDILDRGQEAVKLQNFILSLLDEDRVILIRGNHEDLMIDFIKEYPFYVLMKNIFRSRHYANGTFDTALQLTGVDYITAQTLYGSDEMLDKLSRTPFVQTIIPECVDYFETEHYIFVHGWIPCTKEVAAGKINSRGRKYEYIPSWREFSKSDWYNARWVNGMEVCMKYKVKEPNKTIVCGHWHCSYGHSTFENHDSEIGENADFSPFYSDGIIALDACTALSGIVNCIVLED